ncbi:MAG: choice-of-anchor L domain-containing protein [Chitinophagales bacterium]|nr:choice-of-anchor L domain-containing protein [Chitinophagales bacterium]
MGRIYIALVFALLLCSCGSAYSQIAVTTNNNGAQLAQILSGNGVTISNVQMNCPAMAAGTFTCTNCNVGMSQGIVLTSGDAQLVAGPNNSGSQGLDNLAPGNPQLNTLAGATTYDACTLEFDMEVLSDSVEFRYVFGSEEYLEWVNSGFNDAFAFYISGPGIAGQQNIALIPGTATPVTIDNVNNISYPQYYVDNGTGFNAPYSTSPYYIQYDGFTTVLTAKRKGLQPCQIYHLRLTIADAGDGIYDSGVFLEANSLTSNAVHLDSVATTSNPNVSNAMEGCIDGSIRFYIEQPVNVPITIHYGIGGTAINGVDYTHIADSITLPANASDVFLSIHPISDGLVEGTETVVIYLYNTCSTVPYDSAVLLIVDSFGLAVSGDTTICAGQSVKLYASGSFNYVWTPAATLDNNTIPQPTATPAVTTTYLCTTNIAGCVSSDSVTVTVIPPPFSVNAGPDINDCSGLPVQLNAVVTGSTVGGQPFQYSWSPTGPLNNSTIANPQATIASNTTFAVEVTSGGCKANDTVNVTVGSLTISATATNTTCSYLDDGTATVTVQNPNGNYTYQWSNSATTQNLTALGSGSYTVTVTQNANCTASASVTVQSPPAILFASPVVNNTTCFGGNDGSISITASGGTGSLVYLWSNGGSSSSIGSLVAGSYVVTASDVNSCTATASATVSSPPQLQLSLSHTDITCFGNNDGTATATATGGTGTISLLWSNGSSSATINSLPPANYSVTATDANACSVSASVNVNEPALLTVSLSAVAVSCFGGANGIVSSNVSGGTGNKTFLWSNGAVTANLNNVAANTYSVTVTDANNCTASASIVVAEPTQLTLTYTTVNVTCFGGNNGSIDITVTGGAPQYAYNWSSGTGSEDLLNVAANSYSVTVTDANSCTVSSSIAVNQPTQIVFGSPVITNVSCKNGADGMAEVTPTGGTGSYTYTWNNAPGSNPQSGLVQGNYTVVVTDINGCTASTNLVVTEPALLTANPQVTHATCFAGNNGSIDANPSGGTPPYSFVWNDSQSQTTQTAVALYAGLYFVAITDNNGCSITTSALVNEPTEMLFTTQATNVSCPGDEDGTITVIPTGATPPYSYSVTQDGANFVYSTDGVILNLAAGSYSVIVSDNNGCTKMGTAIVPDAVPDVFTITTDSTSCYGTAYNDGAIHIEGTTVFNMPYKYAVDGGTLQFSGDFFFLGAGNHQVTAVNSFGCVTNLNVVVPEPANAVATILPGDTTLQIGQTVQLFTSFSPYPASTITEYVWSPTTGLSCMDCPNPVALPYDRKTEYVLTITYNNHCVTTASAIVFVEGNPEVFIPNTFTPNGDGNNDVFKVYGEHIMMLEMDLFNRWGEKVCTFTSQYDGWDGTYKGLLQNPGVYVYNATITFLTGKKVQRMGSVTLMR